MLEVPLCDASGKRLETLKLEESRLGGRLRQRLLKQALIAYRAGQRVAVACTKPRSEVAGSRRKLYRQKGTGLARRGSRQSPVLRGGGTWGGPRPHDYSQKLNKKARRLALRSALLGKFRDHEVTVVEGLGIDEPKTRKAAALLRSLGIERSCLLVIREYDEMILRAVRNLPRTELRVVKDLNAYDVLRFKRLVFTRRAYDLLLGAGDGEAQG